MIGTPNFNKYVLTGLLVVLAILLFKDFVGYIKKINFKKISFNKILTSTKEFLVVGTVVAIASIILVSVASLIGYVAFYLKDLIGAL